MMNESLSRDDQTEREGSFLFAYVEDWAEKLVIQKGVSSFYHEIFVLF